ncbi:hypothetical protein R3P38DRAFT_3277455 [Favolaschia claudopus]|uniref:Uncharacterized protein n=1 Tax=Favolaschia claudopus TaxID=2862362 RepID=A0AAW0AQJ8_9AGAR
MVNNLAVDSQFSIPVLLLSGLCEGLQEHIGLLVTFRRMFKDSSRMKVSRLLLPKKIAPGVAYLVAYGVAAVVVLNLGLMHADSLPCMPAYDLKAERLHLCSPPRTYRIHYPGTPTATVYEFLLHLWSASTFHSTPHTLLVFLRRSSSVIFKSPTSAF